MKKKDNTVKKIGPYRSSLLAIVHSPDEHDALLDFIDMSSDTNIDFRLQKIIGNK